MRLRSVLGSMLIAALAPAAVQAQPLTRPGRITGTVFDSTSMLPLAGAMVQVVRLDDPATARQTSTDAQGAFHVDSLPPAGYAVATFHPRLDSLGVWQLSRGVQLREGQRARVRLDVPSARTMISRVCGDATLRKRLGYVRGQLRDAEHGGRTVRGTVRVQWLEFAVTRAGMERSVPTLFADTDEDGSFTACGVPTEGILRVRGWSGADSSGAAELTVPPDGILLRDLYVGRA